MEHDLSFEYVGEVNSSLECAICKSAFYNPTLTPCQHVFCSLCITRAIELSPTCPIDRSPLTLEDLMEAPRLVKQMVDELKVVCQSCGQESERALLERHLQDCVTIEQSKKKDPKGKGKELEMEEEMKNCKYCSEKVKLSTSCSHESTCAISLLNCTYCTLPLTRQLLPSHLLLCPYIPIPCPHATYGCTARIPRSLMLEDHLEVTCPYEPIKDFLIRYEGRIGEVEGENVVLRKRCEMLEEGMKDMKELLEGIKIGMGSYWGPTLGLERSKEISIAPPVLVSREGGRESLEEADIEEFFDPPPQPLPSISLSPGLIPPLSPSFVPSSLPANPLPSSSLSPSFSSTLSSIFITDQLDLQPLPLPSVLSYLSNSIESLSTSLISLEERQNSNLMNETIRIQEDVGSIRGVVHGMRMQMHHLLMEVTSNQQNNRMGMMNGIMMSNGNNSRIQMDHSTSSDGADSNSDDDNSSGSNAGGMIGGGGIGRYRYYNSSLPPPLLPPQLQQQQQVRMGMGSSPPYPVIYPMGGGGMKL